MAYTLLGLGLVDVVEDRPEAREHILYSLRLRQEMDNKWAQTSSLIGVAVLALRGSNPKFAAQLLSLVQSALNALHAVIEADVLPLHAQTLEAVREQLGEAAFLSAWEEGLKWNLEETVKKVLVE